MGLSIGGIGSPAWTMLARCGKGVDVLDEHGWPSISRRAALAATVLPAAVWPAALLGCDAKKGDDGAPSVDGVDAPGSPDAAGSPVPCSPGEVLAGMTLEQRVGQLFMVRPEQLAGEASRLEASIPLVDALEKVPVGGVCLFSQNMETARQVEDFLSDAPACWRDAGAPSPFLAVDEEGGALVARVANSGLFDVERVPDMCEVGATGDPGSAARVGSTIAGYLLDIGFNVDFAPVADVLTNPDNPVIGKRSFGGDPSMVGEMVAAQVEAMLEAGILPCAKHFPGHGDTREDSHTGSALTGRSAEELAVCEYIPFKMAIDAGCPMVMVGHIQAPQASGDNLPASLSPKMIVGALRGELGFDGVVVADSFEMGAITQVFDADEAAVRFIEAGGDLILLPIDLLKAFRGVLDAVSTGRISRERIDQSVLRILGAKRSVGLLG